MFSFKMKKEVWDILKWEREKERKRKKNDESESNESEIYMKE